MDFFSGYTLDEFEMVLITPGASLDLPESCIQQHETTHNFFDTVDTITSYEKLVPPDLYPHKCEKCEAVYQTEGWLQRHMSRCRVGRLSANQSIDEDPSIKPKRKPYLCKTCGEKFGYRHVLMRHKRIHTGERPFPCQYCDCKFSDSGDRLKHVRRHIQYRQQRERIQIISHEPPPQCT